MGYGISRYLIKDSLTEGFEVAATLQLTHDVGSSMIAQGFLFLILGVIGGGATFTESKCTLNMVCRKYIKYVTFKVH